MNLGAGKRIVSRRCVTAREAFKGLNRRSVNFFFSLSRESGHFRTNLRAEGEERKRGGRARCAMTFNFMKTARRSYPNSFPRSNCGSIISLFVHSTRYSRTYPRDIPENDSCRLRSITCNPERLSSSFTARIDEGGRDREKERDEEGWKFYIC